MSVRKPPRVVVDQVHVQHESRELFGTLIAAACADRLEPPPAPCALAAGANGVKPTRRVPAELKVTCPSCGGQASQVLETRGRLTLDGVYRRRRCGECGSRFSTRETLTHPSDSASLLDNTTDTGQREVAR